MCILCVYIYVIIHLCVTQAHTQFPLKPLSLSTSRFFQSKRAKWGHHVRSHFRPPWVPPSAWMNVVSKTITSGVIKHSWESPGTIWRFIAGKITK